MENDRVMLGVLILILVVVGSNLVMYGFVRGMARGNKSNWISSIQKSLNKPLDGSANKSMDELRKKIEELEVHKKKEK